MLSGAAWAACAFEWTLKDAQSEFSANGNGPGRWEIGVSGEKSLAVVNHSRCLNFGIEIAMISRTLRFGPAYFCGARYLFAGRSRGFWTAAAVLTHRPGCEIQNRNPPVKRGFACEGGAPDRPVAARTAQRAKAGVATEAPILTHEYHIEYKALFICQPDEITPFTSLHTTP